MRINANIAANYASRLWTGVSTFLFVPAYLRMLGPEAFGLVTFSTSILGIVFIVDMGMSNAFAREVARKKDRANLADLLRSLEWLYLAVVVIVAILAVTGSGWIADNWLNAARLTRGQVQWSVGLMLVSAVLQVMMSLYIGGLLGSNRHVAAAGYQIGFSIVRSGLVLVPLYFWPKVEIVFAWQLAASLTGLLLLRWTIWRGIDPISVPRFSGNALRTVGGFAGGMFGIAVISAINTQSDKIVVSRMFSLNELGQYSIGSLVGQIPSMLALPLAVTVLPHLTSHVSNSEHIRLAAVYMRYSQMIGIAAFTATIGIIVGTRQILMIITGMPPTHELVAVTRLLAAGGGLLAAQYMPYHLAIASGHTRTSVVFGCVSAIVLPVAMLFCTDRLGLLGAAIPWLGMNATVAVLLAWRIMPRFLGSGLAEWTWKANVLPLVISGAVIGPGIFVLPMLHNALLAVFVLGLFCAAGVAANVLFLFYPLRKKSPVGTGLREIQR